jgi:hypothetical protein
LTSNTLFSEDIINLNRNSFYRAQTVQLGPNTIHATN